MPRQPDKRSRQAPLGRPVAPRAVVTVCARATAPPPSLAEFHSLLPVSFQKLFPRIGLILCKAQVFLHGLLSLALTRTSRANEKTASQWSNDTVDLF